MERRTFYKYLTNSPKKFKQLFRRHKILSLLVGIVSLILILTISPVGAAERVYFNYGALNFSVSVQSLETFAKEGKVESDLAFYLNRLSPEKKAQFRDFLNLRYKLSPVTLSRFFSSDIGERLLSYMGELIQIQGGGNGLYGIRAALVQAAADPEGLSPLNFIRKFPTNIQLNTEGIMQQMEAIPALVKETNALVASLEKTASEIAASEPKLDVAQLPNLQASGKFNYVVQTRTMRDPVRQREFLTRLYLPEDSTGSQIPVIVISNGLGTKFDRFDYLARHLASHGFFVAMTQHPGSDDKQQEAFLQGFAKDMFKSTEFINRPLDVTYFLDELERINQSEFKGKLNLEKVGIFGNSLGGYTALALAGAEINFEQLEKDCSPKKNLVNLSLLIQCQALELPRKTYSFKDNRIKAVSVLFPGSSSIFGKAGLSRINVPVVWGAVSQDLFSPLVEEQLPSFNWLTTPEKYLAVVEGVQHINLNFSALRNFSSMDNNSTAALLVDEPEAVKEYVKTLSIAFFQVYIANNPEYRRYLTASYAQAISESPYSLILVKSLNGILANK